LKPGRMISPPGTYFVTFSTWQRRRLFVVENCVRLFLKILYRYERKNRYQLHAFVLMPEHVHLLLTPAKNVTIEHAVQLIKGGYSHELGAVLGRKRQIWQRGFTDHRIRDPQDFAHHQDYIHRNPLERHIVIDAAEFRYSSAYPGYRLDPWFPRVNPAFSKSV